MAATSEMKAVAASAREAYLTLLGCTEEQKNEFIPRITNLEHTWCTLYSGMTVSNPATS